MFNLKKLAIITVGAFVASQLSGCGQVGPLYLPKPAQQKQPAHVKAASNDFDDHRLISKN